MPSKSRSNIKFADDSIELLNHWHEIFPNDRMRHLIVALGRAYRRSMQNRLAPYEVNFAHWIFLRTLWVRDGLTQSELSAETGLMASTVLVALRSMEAVGYVELRRLPENRRNVFVHLTPMGRRLKKKLLPLADEVNEIALKKLRTTEIAEVHRHLLVIFDNLLRDCAAYGKTPARSSAE